MDRTIVATWLELLLLAALTAALAVEDAWLFPVATLAMWPFFTTLAWAAHGRALSGAQRVAGSLGALLVAPAALLVLVAPGRLAALGVGAALAVAVAGLTVGLVQGAMLAAPAASRGRRATAVLQ